MDSFCTLEPFSEEKVDKIFGEIGLGLLDKDGIGTKNPGNNGREGFSDGRLVGLNRWSCEQDAVNNVTKPAKTDESLHTRVLFDTESVSP